MFLSTPEEVLEGHAPFQISSLVYMQSGLCPEGVEIQHREKFLESQNLSPKGSVTALLYCREAYSQNGNEKATTVECISDLYSLKVTLTKKQALTWDENGDCSLHRLTDDVVHRKHPVGSN